MILLGSVKHFESDFIVLVCDARIAIHVFLVNGVSLRKHSERSFHDISCFYQTRRGEARRELVQPVPKQQGCVVLMACFSLSATIWAWSWADQVFSSFTRCSKRMDIIYHLNRCRGLYAVWLTQYHNYNSNTRANDKYSEQYCTIQRKQKM